MSNIVNSIEDGDELTIWELATRDPENQYHDIDDKLRHSSPSTAHCEAGTTDLGHHCDSTDHRIQRPTRDVLVEVCGELRGR